MTAKIDDLGALHDYTRRAFVPASRLNELVAQNVERVARFQYEIAGDWMNLALEQFHAVTQARDVGAMLARNADLAGRFAEQAARRQRDFAKLSADAQAGFARWYEDTTAGIG